MDVVGISRVFVSTLLLDLGGILTSARAQETFQLVIPERTTLCEVGKNGPIDIAQEILAQIDLIAGTLELRTDVEVFEGELIETFRVGAPDRIAHATAPGLFTRRAFSGGRAYYVFEQRFRLGDERFDITFFSAEFLPGDPPRTFNEEDFVSENGGIFALWNQTWFMDFGPCGLAGQRFVYDVRFEGDRRVQIQFRTLQRNACGAWVRIPSARLDLPDLAEQTIEQRDYWKLATWSVCHFFSPDDTQVLFDEPIGEVFGIRINGVTGEYLNQNLERIQTFNVSSEEYTFIDGLKINEVMPDNRTSFADEVGDFDPWIEIYNPYDFHVDLEGIGLTNDMENPDRRMFPEGASIEAKGFALVWADGEPEEGPLHASFRLEPASGEVALFDRTVFGASEWDQTSYGPQAPDRSIGRLPDGEGEFMELDFPSPGTSNNSPPPSPTATNTPTPVPTFVNERSDIDGSGDVDAMDLLILLADWMKSTDAR